mmetsp:Transcript_46442/g.129235  ORF Transcript_46442/g.129235 Transcript_46442/m.129235 type:complete len:208 (+) Transcript_46442:345-968(+)
MQREMELASKCACRGSPGRVLGSPHVGKFRRCHCAPGKLPRRPTAMRSSPHFAWSLQHYRLDPCELWRRSLVTMACTSGPLSPRSQRCRPALFDRSFATASALGMRGCSVFRATCPDRRRYHLQKANPLRETSLGCLLGDPRATSILATRMRPLRCQRRRKTTWVCPSRQSTRLCRTRWILQASKKTMLTRHWSQARPISSRLWFPQ